MDQDPRFHEHPHRAVAYTGKGGLGHCVVSGPTNVGAHVDGDFVCYQGNPYGVDVLHEVRAAELIFVFQLPCVQYSPEWYSWIDRKTRRMLERRSDPIWISKKREIIESSLRTLQAQPHRPAGKGKRAGAAKLRRTSASCGEPTGLRPGQGDFPAKIQESLAPTERLLPGVALTLAVLFLAMATRGSALMLFGSYV